MRGSVKIQLHRQMFCGDLSDLKSFIQLILIQTREWNISSTFQFGANLFCKIGFYIDNRHRATNLSNRYTERVWNKYEGVIKILMNLLIRFSITFCFQPITTCVFLFPWNIMVVSDDFYPLCPRTQQGKLFLIKYTSMCLGDYILFSLRSFMWKTAVLSIEWSTGVSIIWISL